MRRASDARRPDTHATTPYCLATSMSGRRVVSGMWASSGCSTMGASTPSTSSSTADRVGWEIRGASRSWRVEAPVTALVCPPMRRVLQLAAIGTAAGVFSGLFGVGGGTVAVPLLVLWLGYGERMATGTSRLAICLIAAGGAAVHAGY